MTGVNPVGGSEIEQLEVLGKSLKGKTEYRRLQCVLLRVKYHKDVDEIAEMLQIHRRTVYKHQERYRQEGLKAFEARKVGSPEGPRLMSSEEEKAVLQSLEEKAGRGQLLTGGQVKEALEEKLGKPVALSTVYVFLHRNAWSKQQPRPRHPKGDEKAKSLFKKITEKNC
jgi:transposase